MNGICCPAPAMISSEADSFFLASFTIGSPRNFGNVLHPAPAGRVPLVPVRHKSCRPSNIQVPWLVSKAQNSGKLAHVNSNDSEKDLAAMVSDFIESEAVCDGYDSSDKESTGSGFTSFFENLKRILVSASVAEWDLRSLVRRALSSISEDSDLACSGGIECGGSCTLLLLVKWLRTAGYDAGLCKSRWQSAGRVPGGEYEYIDVILPNEDRFIIDLDFQSHFEIARPVPNYMVALQLLPTVFVGTSKKLRKVLDAMSDAARGSLKQNSMHLPPWRTVEYMRAKWFSTHGRQTMVDDTNNTNVNDINNRTDLAVGKGGGQLVIARKGCGEQLRRIKACVVLEDRQHQHHHHGRAISKPKSRRRPLVKGGV